MSRWYKKSFWRNLVDMHIPDWNPEFMSKFSPSQYADYQAEAEVDAAELYSGNCLGICFWPTKAGHMHQGLKGQDIVEPTLALLRQKGMYTNVYFNIWSRWAFDTHPHWRMQRPDGTNTTQSPGGGKSRFGQCCLNSPGYRAYVKAQIQDLATRFEFDGFWVDMLGWFGTLCCCPDCRKRYYDETGHEIPEKIDWFDPEWVLFQRKREEWMVDMAHLVRSALHEIKPSSSITFNCAAWQRGWSDAVTQAFMDVSDYLAGDFFGNSLMYTAICKFLNNVTQNRPIEFMTSRCVSLRDHTTMKTKQELAYSACGSFAHNCAFVFIDAINPDGTMNPELYRNMGELHRAIKKYQDELAPDAVMLRDVSFLFNFESFINPKANGTSIREMAEGLNPEILSGSPRAKMMNISQFMISNHIAYDLTCYKEIDTALRNSQLIVIPNQYVMLDEEIASLQSFVENGGTVLITGQSGIVDKQGNKLNDFAHANLSGVHLAGQTEQDVTYLRPMDGYASLFHPYDEKYLMSVDVHSMLVKADADVDVLAKLTLPYSHSQEIFKFGSAISNPPGIETDYPAVTVRQCGKGRVMYIAVPLEENPYEAQQKVLINLMSYMINKPLVIETNAPAWLECLVYRDNENKRYLIYLCKIMGKYYECAAHNVSFSLAINETTGKLVDVSNGLDVPYQEKDGRLSFSVDRIDDFAMYTLEIMMQV